MEFPADLLSKIDIAQLVAFVALFWFFNSRMDRKFDKMEQNFNQRFDKMDLRFDKVDQRFDKVDQRFDKLEETVKDVDRRLCRLEGAFASKDCCMIKEHVHHKKAE